MDKDIQHTEDGTAAQADHVDGTAADAAETHTADDAAGAQHAADAEPAPEAAPQVAEAAAPSPLAGDLSGLVSDEIAVAKNAAKAEIDTAVSAAEKMLAIASGDTSQLLTDGEAAVINLVAHNAGPAGSLIASFAASALSATGINTVAEAGVAKALAYALGWLKVLQASLEGDLS